MAKMLTHAALLRLKARSKRQEIRDAGARALYVTIQPSGIKSWTMRFRRPNGRSAKLTLGPVDLSGREAKRDPVLGAPMSLAAARWMAAEIEHRRQQGRDVIAELHTDKVRKRLEAERRAINTFGAAVREYLDGYARPKIRRWHEIARILGLRYENGNGEPTVIEGSLAWRWRDKPLVDIGPDDIFALIEEARHKGIPGMAKRTAGASNGRARAMGGALSGLFGWLIKQRKIATNPCRDVHMPEAPKARERTLTDNEIRWLWAACDKAATPFGQCVKTLLLTAARLGEVSAMTHDEIRAETVTQDGQRTEGTFWQLEGNRTKNGRPHLLPLDPLSLAILKSVPQVSGKSGYVFTTNGRSPISGFSKCKKALDEAMQRTAGRSPVPHWTLHDLRRTAATGMSRIGIKPEVVEACLNHVSGAKAGVAGVYNRYSYLAEKKTAFERWANHIQAVVSGKRGNVVPIQRVS